MLKRVTQQQQQLEDVEMTSSSYATHHLKTLETIIFNLVVSFLGIISGFPVPYVGIVTKTGSFSALVTPMLNHR